MNFEAIFAEAQAAGKAAAEALTPSVMVVGSPSTPFGTDVDLTKEHWIETEGPCGFAWIDVTERKNSPFAKWLKANGYAKDAYDRKGVYIWISDYNQSMQRKEAHANAMAKVLRDHGIKAYAGSRLD